MPVLLAARRGASSCKDGVGVSPVLLAMRRGARSCRDGVSASPVLLAMRRDADSFRDGVGVSPVLRAMRRGAGSYRTGVRQQSACGSLVGGGGAASSHDPSDPATALGFGEAVFAFASPVPAGGEAKSGFFSRKEERSILSLRSTMGLLPHRRQLGKQTQSLHPKSPSFRLRLWTRPPLPAPVTALLCFRHHI